MQFMYMIDQRVSADRPIALRVRMLVIVAALSCQPLFADAWILTITPGTRTVYLGVGNSTTNAANATINLVSVAVAASVVGTGAAQASLANVHREAHWLH